MLKEERKQSNLNIYKPVGGIKKTPEN